MPIGRCVLADVVLIRLPQLDLYVSALFGRGFYGRACVTRPHKFGTRPLKTCGGHTMCVAGFQKLTSGYRTWETQ